MPIYVFDAAFIALLVRVVASVPGRLGIVRGIVFARKLRAVIFSPVGGVLQAF